MLFVENTIGGDVTVFDEADDYRKVGTLTFGGHILPDDICANKSGSLLYANGTYQPEHLHAEDDPERRRQLFMSDYDGKIANNGGKSSGHLHEMSGDLSVLVAFDTQSLKEVWRVDIRGHVGHLAITPDDRYVFNAVFDEFFTARVDTVSREVDYIPMPFNGGHGMAVSHDGKYAYVGSILMSELDIIEIESGAIAQRMLFPDNVRPFAFTKDGRTAYVQNSRFHGFHVFDVRRNAILRSIALPPLPPGTPVIEAFPHTVDHGMALTPNEDHLLALATTGNYLAIYSHPDLELLGTVELGGEPSWIIVDQDGRNAYCSNRVTDDVSVVSIADQRETHRFKAGRYPQRMWIT